MIKMLSDDFGELMNQTVFIQPRSCSGTYGATYGEGKNYDCYIERTIKNITDKTGKAAVSSCQIFMDPATIGDGDKVTLDGASPPILKLEENVDEEGEDYSLVIYT
jgi:hypothetical protein